MPNTRFISISLVAMLALAACKKKDGASDTSASETQAQGEKSQMNAQGEPKMIPAPKDVAKPPTDALKAKDASGKETGLAYKILKASGSKEKPSANDTVKVHYTGWTTDGKMFDSSVMRGEPATFSLRGVIPGWTEGMQLVAKGDKARLWIPEEMAYKGRPGAPQGMLVFDVELLDIVRAPQTPSDVAAPPADASKTKSGLAYKILKPGASAAAGKPEKPRAWDKVKVHYTGWTTDGMMFDSSIARGQPAEFPLSAVIPGWTEGLQLLSVGDKARLWIPEEMAYKGRPGAPQGMLVFDVELLGVERMPAPPETPSDVAKPPAAAKKVTKGKDVVAYIKTLKPGTGKQHPTETSRVKVQYTGWTTDGKMFDSSVTRGQPAEFPLNGVIPGWTEGLQKMAVGEKARIWIPEEFAYKGQPGRPQGMLVFDVELLEIK